jgi:hypothetical protein
MMKASLTVLEHFRACRLTLGPQNAQPSVSKLSLTRPHQFQARAAAEATVKPGWGPDWLHCALDFTHHGTLPHACRAPGLCSVCCMDDAAGALGSSGHTWATQVKQRLPGPALLPSLACQWLAQPAAMPALLVVLAVLALLAVPALPPPRSLWTGWVSMWGPWFAQGLLLGHPRPSAAHKGTAKALPSFCHMDAAAHSHIWSASPASYSLCADPRPLVAALLVAPVLPASPVLLVVPARSLLCGWSTSMVSA